VSACKHPKAARCRSRWLGHRCFLPQGHKDAHCADLKNGYWRIWSVKPAPKRRRKR